MMLSDRGRAMAELGINVPLTLADALEEDVVGLVEGIAVVGLDD